LYFLSVGRQRAGVLPGHAAEIPAEADVDFSGASGGIIAQLAPGESS
jgi:hypothetical protein